MPARKTNRRDGIESDAPGILLGACILAVLAMLLIASLLAGLAAGPLKPGNATILLGVYLIGDPMAIYIGPEMTAELIARIRQELGAHAQARVEHHLGRQRPARGLRREHAVG